LSHETFAIYNAVSHYMQSVGLYQHTCYDRVGYKKTVAKFYINSHNATGIVQCSEYYISCCLLKHLKSVSKWTTKMTIIIQTMPIIQ